MMLCEKIDVDEVSKDLVTVNGSFVKFVAPFECC